ncbi:MAG TPA: MerR family DNA-binding transcriptional regulator [Rhodocyclaceae bacterium]|nr:MerR family DNA-binding transcriptional regulator [Rhodocyclaceae bacterium]
MTQDSAAATHTAPDATLDATSSAANFVATHRDESSTELFGITELARDFDVSPRAIRFYEDKGLLSPRRINGGRAYTRRDRARLALILRGKAIGFALSEIQHYLELYGDCGEGRSQQLRFVMEKTDAAIAELEARRAHIETTLAELRLINDGVKKELAAK